jgi:hypothetical protein
MEDQNEQIRYFFVSYAWWNKSENMKGNGSGTISITGKLSAKKVISEILHKKIATKNKMELIVPLSYPQELTKEQFDEWNSEEE